MNKKHQIKKRRRGWVVYLAAIVGAAAAAQVSLGDEITLKGSVRLKEGAETVRLADIAELTGPNAQRFAETSVAEVSDSAEAIEITVRQVRSRLDDAGAHWGLIQLNGRTVIVRPAASRAATPPLTMTPVAIEQPAAPQRAIRTAATYEVAADLIGLTTLRGTLARMFVEGLTIHPKKLRLVFGDHNAELLETDANAARFEIQPLGTATGSS
jgi:hypothetical protein